MDNSDAFDRADSPDQESVEAWLAGEPDIEAAQNALQQLWELTSPGNAPDGWDALDKKIEEIERRTRARPVLTLRQPQRTIWPALMRTAAVLIVGAGVGLFGQSAWRSSQPKAPERVLVPAGSQSSVELPGGVSVRLNYASELSYIPARKVREVELKGEAYISVPNGAKHNFIVRTEAGVVRDLGTEFNVRARHGMTSVTVTKGRVELGSSLGKVTLHAGQEAAIAIGGIPTAPTEIDIDAALGWLSRRLTFFDQPLAQVAQELEYRYGATFKIADALRATRITAKINPDASAADAAEVICFTVQARCSQNGSQWTIAK